MARMSPAQITAQVAVEAIIEHAADYSPRTIAAVRAQAIEAGVAAFYTDMIPAPAASENCAHEPNGWDCDRYTACPAYSA